MEIIMNNQSTNAHLYQFENEIQNLQKSILGILLKGRIAEFHKQNGERIKSLFDSLRILNESYFVIENNEIVIQEVEGKKSEKMIEGKTKEEYEIKLAQLMKKPINIIL